MQLPQFAKLYPFHTLAIAACPTAACFAITLTILGQGIESPAISQIAEMTLHAGMKAMLPVGFVCAILSWRLARTVEPPSDSRDVVEFLLGASAFIMIVLGGIFATY